MSNRNIGILISGRGSNMQAIIDAIASGNLDAKISVVISNRPNAKGLERAKKASIETLYINHKDYESREAFDRAVVLELKRRNVSLVCLAGFMRLLSAEFVDAFPNRILNIHPSLLPSFTGIDGQKQALDYGVKVTGATVHIVTSELDAGPIVLQTVVSVDSNDTPETLASRILAEEHKIYPRAVGIVLDERWRIENRRFIEI